VAVAVIRPEPSLERRACVARLIPGQKAVQAHHRKGPRSVGQDGVLRVTSQQKSRSHWPSAADLLLPTPFTGNDSREFWAALVTDYALIAIGWTGSGLLSFVPGFHVLPSLLNLPFLGAGFIFAVILTLLGYSEGLYQGRDPRESVAIAAKSVLWATLVVGIGVRLLGFSRISGVGIAAPAVLTLALLVAGRLWRAETLRSPKRSSYRNVLVVGEEVAARQVAAHIDEHPELRRVVRRCLDEDEVVTHGMASFGDRIATLARTEFVDEVILPAPSRRDLARAIIREAQRNRLDVKVLPDLYGYEFQGKRVEHVGSRPLLTLHQERIPEAGLLLKRLMDMAVSGGALFMTGPLLLIIAALVKLDSPGPAFYSAMRLGRKGRRFRCHKFRTMVANAEDTKEQLRGQNQREGPTFKVVKDPRITGLGKWLRRYSIDEVPQLWNVFLGEMSLVGPRPHPLDDCARYELEHLRRLDVTPGITGLWQVTARRSASFHTNMALDLEYIEGWSLWMDLRVLARTVAVVFRGTGS
jgi:exopolysaccharide biosynthesis polyprenyl glycosylphosphotransferase